MLMEESRKSAPRRSRQQVLKAYRPDVALVEMKWAWSVKQIVCLLHGQSEVES
jgi:hypothetical protein